MENTEAQSKKSLWVEHPHRRNKNSGFSHSRNKICLLLMRKGTFDFPWKVLELLPANSFWFKVSLKAAIRMSAESVAIWRLMKTGGLNSKTGHSHGYWQEISISHHMGLSTGCSITLTTWQLNSTRESNLGGRGGGSTFLWPKFWRHQYHCFHCFPSVRNESLSSAQNQ